MSQPPRTNELSSVLDRASRYRTLVRASHHATWFLTPRLPNAFPATMLMGYPKSGNSWVAQQLADYLQVPLPTQSIMPIGCDAVIQSHYAPSGHRNRGVYVLRDGRDVMVSLYFFLSWDIPAGKNPKLNAKQRRLYPGLTDKADCAANLPAFLEQQMRSPVASMGKNWGDHLAAFRRHQGADLALIHYEEMLAHPQTELGSAIEQLTGETVDADRLARTIEKFSFARQSGRQPGEQLASSFLRSGKRGDWCQHFTPEAARVFDRYCGDALVEAGYEPNRDWVEEFSERAVAA